MQPDGNAPLRATAEIQTAASPERVWETLANIGNWASWMPGVKRITAPEALAPGVRFRERNGFVTMRSELTQVQRPRALARRWKSAGFGTKAQEHWTLEEHGAGTIVRTEQSWWGPLPRLLPGPMGSMVRSVTEGRLQALKVEVERSARGRVSAEGTM